MVTALAIAQAAAAAAPRANMAGWCQQYAGLCISAYLGREAPGGYLNATAAMNASGPRNMNPDAAPPGAMHWYAYGVDGHVGLALGSGLMASATGRSAGALMNLGKSIYIHRAATYGLPYLGWTPGNGTRPVIVATDHQAPPPIAGNQRRVRVEARLRYEPSTAAGYDATKNLKAGAVITPLGFVRSALAGGVVDGNATWLKVGDRQFISVTTLTDAGTHDLADLGVIPVPPVIHKVTIDYADGVNAPKVLDVVEGTQVARPSDPGKPGWTFAYWALAAVPEVAFDFTTRVNRDLELVAIYDVVKPDPDPEPEPDPILMRTVTLVYSTGEEDELQVVNGSPIGLVPDPGDEEPGWTFKGWFVDGDEEHPWLFADPVTSDLRLLAVWTLDELPPEPVPIPKPPMSKGLLGVLVTLGGIIVAGVIAWLATLGG